jgi:hypothetical protein
MSLVAMAGVGLLLFGGLVLLRFPNRPGGKLSWGGLEVDSRGAGLPLMLVGLVAIAAANPALPGVVPIGPGPALPVVGTAAAGPAPTVAGTAGVGPGLPVVGTVPAAGPASPVAGTAGDCLARQLAALPANRVATMEVGAVDFDVVEKSRASDGPVAIKVTEGGQPIGALTFRPLADNELFRLESLVDASCRPVDEVRNASRGGDRRVLQNWDEWEFRLGEGRYNLRLGFHTFAVRAGLQRVD